MLRKFFAYYRPHKKLLWLDLSCAILSGLLELVFPLAIAAFIDQLLPAGDWAMTVLAAFGLVAVYLVNTGLMAVVIYWGHTLGINIETEMRARAFAHITRLSWTWFDRNETGKLVSRVTRDLEEIGEVAHHGPEDVLIALMTFIGAFALMLYLHPPLAFITLTIVPVMVWLLAVYGGRMTRTWQAIYGRVGAFNVRLEESIGGIRVVQAFTNENHERDLFDSDNQRYRKTKLEAYRIIAALTALHYMGLRAVQVVVMVAGAGYVFQGGLSAGGYVAFLLLVGVFFRPLEKIAAVVETYPRGIAGFRSYLDLLSQKPDITDAADATPAPALGGEITFDNVELSYDGARGVLHGISLDVKPGETVAFVGPSGAGKTSLMALIPRFYDPTGGEIRIDGVPLQKMTLDSLRKQVGLVSQDVFLFGGTLRDNIAYGRLDATDAEIREAVKQARLEPLIETLPERLDTIVGERGVMLSGGQRQRVAIARVFLRNPPVLLLDEATSALDRSTEREVQAELARLAVGRTTLIIAHRLDTIRHADRIVVIDAGKIVEIGTHDELVARQAAYFAMLG
ncbi:ATP-binding cassette subfamily B protein [Yoonia maritima]|uniref:ATP-binding cassette subfamily B protein n=1 Tax=Yoonia maritima TaxID=1435347 RepID=A0A2T0W013_9RHOB|nr:ABC transporter ATP-binding protein [Yoonia maritima]PRY77770.1 ATP-binding cassette subfamily B protein [Yoonia maritima]